MTIKECIDIVDNKKPNQYGTKEKVMWLSFIDEIIINDVLRTHEGYDGRYDDFIGYSEDRLTVALIVPSPYDRLYTAYLNMKIDEENGETARYNNSATLFNSYLMEYRKYYNKTHLPLNTDKKPMPKAKPTTGISEAEYENLKRELFYLLSEHFASMTSPDKIYDIVMNYVNNNVEMLKGKQGDKGEKGDKGEDGKDAIIDEVFSPTSANAQSGKTIAGELVRKMDKWANVDIDTDRFVILQALTRAIQIFSSSGASSLTLSNNEAALISSLSDFAVLRKDCDNGITELAVGDGFVRLGTGKVGASDVALNGVATPTETSPNNQAANKGYVTAYVDSVVGDINNVLATLVDIEGA